MGSRGVRGDDAKREAIAKKRELLKAESSAGPSAV